MSQSVMFLLFFTIVSSLFGFMQYRLYRLARRWVRRIFDARSAAVWLRRIRYAILVINVLFFAQVFLRTGSVYQSPVVQILLIYPMGHFFAFVVLAFLITLLFDIARGMSWIAKKLFQMLRPRPRSYTPQTRSDVPLDESRRRFLKLGGLSAASIVASAPVIASLETARDYQINKLEIPANIPSGLNGLSIAQVSDIHSGVYMTEQNIREIFELVNSLGANVVMVTGDFVDSSDSQIESLYNTLSMIKAEYGVFGCLGNHDHFATAEKVSSAAEQRGIIMLNNSHSTLKINGEDLSVIGIDDAGHGQSDFSDIDRAFDGMNPESFKIMLTHRPGIWDETRKRGVDLTLAGHTHGGQVGFHLGPLNLNPVHLVHKYAMGHYRDGARHLYVNVGVGMVGVPIRMVRPEISLFTLRPVA